MFLLALFFFWATAFCLPAPSGNTSAGIALRDFDDFSFKGIDWSLARSPGNCKAWQLEILHRATGVAVDMLNPKYWEDGGIDKNIGWVWFFRDENYKNEKNLPVSQGNGWRTRGDVGISYLSVLVLEANSMIGYSPGCVPTNPLQHGASLHFRPERPEIHERSFAQETLLQLPRE